MRPLTAAVIFCLNHIAKRGGDPKVASEARDHIQALESLEPSEQLLTNMIDGALNPNRKPSAAEGDTTGKAAEEL